MRHQSMLAVGLVCGLLASGAVAAGEDAAVGKIAQVEGSVSLHANGAVRGQAVKAPGAALAVGDQLRTKAASTARLTFVDGSQALLTADSTLTIKGLKEYSPQGGRVLFDVRSQGGVAGVIIDTPTAVLGVKGTRFVVEPTEDGANVYLQEGELAVTAKQGEFRMGRPRGAGRPALDPRTEAFKKRLDEEFTKALREFHMPAGTAVAIRGQEVEAIGFSPGAADAFDAFEAWLMDDSDLDDFPDLGK
jgi:ferric-dicitrate binding protein FerR (iron transport regulator)